MTSPESATSSPVRYHGLDALRGIAMLLGIVIHAALPYIPDIKEFWPPDKESSQLISVIFHFIHMWRMPLFFIMAGFFSCLIVTRKSWKNWWGNRLLRIAIPIVVFTPIMSATLPWIFAYGRTGEIEIFYSRDGEPHHLWFLWQLIIFALFTVLMGPFNLLWKLMIRSRNKKPDIVCENCKKENLFGSGYCAYCGFLIDTSLNTVKKILTSIFLTSRFPIGFIIICVVAGIWGWGELHVNPIASGLFFLFGYILYKNKPLLSFMKSYWMFYLLVASIVFVMNLILMDIDIKKIPAKEDAEFIQGLQYLTKMICTVLFCYSLIGLAEDKLGSYNPTLRLISDGSYWIYLIHLPIVTFMTFMMFGWPIPVEIKFLLAIIVTSAICLITYIYLVRSTLIGVLLNGKRYSRKTVTDGAIV